MISARGGGCIIAVFMISIMNIVPKVNIRLRPAPVVTIGYTFLNALFVKLPLMCTWKGICVNV